MRSAASPLRVCLVAIPEALISSLSGPYDVLNAFDLLGTFDDTVPAANPFATEIVAAARASTPTASGLPVAAHRGVDEVEHADIVIIPSVLVEGGEWVRDRHPEVLAWLGRMHAAGAVLCSACSGVLLLAETGLLDGHEATIHWAYAPTFRRNYPRVRLDLDKVLVATGERSEFVMSGASASWHDLVLYLVARHVSPTAAQAISRFMLLQWHLDGQAPYVVFNPPFDHGDAAVLAAQRWLQTRYAQPSPVEEMSRHSGLAPRTFKRRFSRATGHTPIAYVQRLRVEEAKRRLERTDAAVDEIGWAVGYTDPAFFRRLFKRTTHLTPGAYRRRFQLPAFARSAAGGG